MVGTVATIVGRDAVPPASRAITGLAMATGVTDEADRTITGTIAGATTMAMTAIPFLMVQTAATVPVAASAEAVARMVPT